MQKPTLLFLIFLLFSSFAHQFYVSITEIEYNRNTQSLEVSCKVFADDYIFAVEKEYSQKLHFGTANQDPKSDEMFEQYALCRIQIKADGQPLTVKYIGKEIEMDVFWFYFEAPVSNFHKLEVGNNMLMELFPTQTNIIHITLDDQKKSLLLNRNQKFGLVEF